MALSGSIYSRSGLTLTDTKRGGTATTGFRRLKRKQKKGNKMSGTFAVTILILVWTLLAFGAGILIGIKMRPDDQPRDEHGRFTKGA
jgi:hypothetical protein